MTTVGVVGLGAMMSRSAIGSPMLQARAPLVLDLPEQAWFDIQLMQKDLRLALETGHELTVPLPSAAVANELLTSARAFGYGSRDIAALHRTLEHLAGGNPEPLASRTGVLAA